jgi:hypothetical protein
MCNNTYPTIGLLSRHPLFWQVIQRWKPIVIAFNKMGWIEDYPNWF